MKKIGYLLLATLIGPLLPASTRAAEPGIFGPTNLVAWCVVPFDAKKRGPEERAQMLDRLGIKRLAYDWRPEHIPTFEAEIEACRKHGIELTAWWFPTSLDKDAKTILGVLEKNRLQTQLWVMGGGEPARNEADQRERINTEVERIRPIAEAAGRIGCSVGLYNHGGWFGEPENQVAIIKALGMPRVGIVYNFHHGHHQMARFPELFRIMQPYLMALNINGMVKDGDKRGQKILEIGAGDQELAMLKVVRNSGWRGPIGILNHRQETDSEETLRKNLEGLAKLVKQLER